jgi:hypothetical protein
MGAQVRLSFFAAAFMASSAFCIGAGSGMVTVVEPPAPPRVPPVPPVEPVDAVLVEPADPDDEEELDDELDGRADAPDAPDPVEPVALVELDDSAWSDVSWACAWSKVAWASVTAACSGVWSIVASCWPGVTVSPTLTRTPVTVPFTGKAVVTCETRLTVPVRVSVWETDPLPAVASRYAESVSGLLTWA